MKLVIVVRAEENNRSWYDEKAVHKTLEITVDDDKALQHIVDDVILLGDAVASMAAAAVDERIKLYKEQQELEAAERETAKAAAGRKAEPGS
jgi:hypothetical protein